MTATAVIRGADRRHEVELGLVTGVNQWYAKCSCGFIEIHVVAHLAEAAGFRHIEHINERNTK